MIYTASYFESECHHGSIVSISRSHPPGIIPSSHLPFFTPSSTLLQRWKQGLSIEDYQRIFWAELEANRPMITQWLDRLDPAIDQTLCCYERSNAADPRKRFCHRNMVASIVKKYRPDCFGGCDFSELRKIGAIEIVQQSLIEV